MAGIETPQDAAPGPVKTAISTAIVRIFKEHYGLGPTAARVFLEDDYVFVAMHGGFTRNEHTLMDAGHHQLVRDYRLRFQEAISELSRAAIAEATGRTVTAHHSQVVFDPDMTFEIFVLEPRDAAG
jgi:uncharacterized protein YbcI